VTELRGAGIDAAAGVCDVGSSAEVDARFAETESALGPVDVLVNNAGINRFAMLHNMSDADWDEVIRVNLTAYFYTCRAAARSMRPRKAGSIVNISSMAAQRGSIGQINYASAKAGIIGLTKSVARELARHGVRANAIAPGTVETAMTARILTDDKLSGPLLAEIPLGRVGQPGEIARVACFLASDDASFMTGQVLGVNGGTYL
jgi:3-oxoacyl-[acyl-carrier protein] reductase/2-hydroxycyclohexanecarboxyl-CoA dehydrogenase